MNQEDQHLDTLYEIRNMMEKSSRFISLSGLSGVFAGIYALVGAALAFSYLKLDIFQPAYYDYLYDNKQVIRSTGIFFIANALSVLTAALATCLYLSIRKARKQGLPIWTSTSRRLLVSVAIPLGVGGIFCLALIYHQGFGLIAPATLLFYGLALINGSKYTLHDVHYLGICEIILGLIGSFFTGYGLLLWTMGFGVLHVVYGTLMYYKYER